MALLGETGLGPWSDVHGGLSPDRVRGPSELMVDGVVGKSEKHGDLVLAEAEVTGLSGREGRDGDVSS